MSKFCAFYNCHQLFYVLKGYCTVVVIFIVLYFSTDIKLSTRLTIAWSHWLTVGISLCITLYR